MYCKDWKKLRWPKLPFTHGKRPFVRSFALTVLELLRFGTIQSVAQHLDVSWDLDKEIYCSKLCRLYGSIPLNKVEYTGIDEFGISRGHQYMTIFVDLGYLISLKA